MLSKFSNKSIFQLGSYMTLAPALTVSKLAAYSLLLGSVILKEIITESLIYAKELKKLSLLLPNRKTPNPFKTKYQPASFRVLQRRKFIAPWLPVQA